MSSSRGNRRQKSTPKIYVFNKKIASYIYHETYRQEGRYAITVIRLSVYQFIELFFKGPMQSYRCSVIVQRDYGSELRVANQREPTLNSFYIFNHLICGEGFDCKLQSIITCEINL